MRFCQTKHVANSSSIFYARFTGEMQCQRTSTKAKQVLSVREPARPASAAPPALRVDPKSVGQSGCRSYMVISLGIKRESAS